MRPVTAVYDGILKLYPQYDKDVTILKRDLGWKVVYEGPAEGFSTSKPGWYVIVSEDWGIEDQPAYVTPIELDGQYLEGFIDVHAFIKNLPRTLQNASKDSNIYQLALISQLMNFEFRKNVFDIQQARLKMSYPLFVPTNIATRSLPSDWDSFMINDVDLITKNRIENVILEEPNEDFLPKYLRGAFTFEEPFLPWYMFINPKPIVQLETTAETQRLVKLYLYVATDKIYVVSEDGFILKEWEIQARAADLTPEYLITLEQAKIKIYDWFGNLKVEYNIQTADPWGIVQLQNLFVVYDEGIFKIFEARYPYFSTTETELMIYDVFPEYGITKGDKTYDLTVLSYIKKQWQSFDEMLWIMGYKRSDKETLGQAFQVQLLRLRTSEPAKEIIKKNFYGYQEDTLEDAQSFVFVKYATNMTFEDQKWGDSTKPIGQIGAFYTKLDEDDYDVPIQLFQGYLLDKDGLHSFNETSSISVYHEKKFRVASENQVMVPQTPFARAFHQTKNLDVIEPHQLADEYIVKWENGEEKSYEPGHNIVILNKLDQRGEKIPFKLYQRQGMQLIPVIIAGQFEDIVAREDKYTLYSNEQVYEVEPFEANDQPKKGNALIYYTNARHANKLSVDYFIDSGRLFVEIEGYWSDKIQPEEYSYVPYSITVQLFSRSSSIIENKIIYNQSSLISSVDDSIIAKAIYHFDLVYGYDEFDFVNNLNLDIAPFIYIYYTDQQTSNKVMVAGIEKYTINNELVLPSDKETQLTNLNAKILVPHIYNLMVIPQGQVPFNFTIYDKGLYNFDNVISVDEL